MDSPQPMTPLPVIRYRVGDDEETLEVCAQCEDNIVEWLHKHQWSGGVPEGDMLLARILAGLSEFVDDEGNVQGAATDITLRLKHVLSGVVST